MVYLASILYKTAYENKLSRMDVRGRNGSVFRFSQGVGCRRSPPIEFRHHWNHGAIPPRANCVHPCSDYHPGRGCHSHCLFRPRQPPVFPLRFTPRQGVPCQFVWQELRGFAFVAQGLALRGNSNQHSNNPFFMPPDELIQAKLKAQA